MNTKQSPESETEPDEVWYGMGIGAFVVLMVTVIAGVLVLIGQAILDHFEIKTGILPELFLNIGLGVMAFGWTQLLYLPLVALWRKRIGKTREAVGIMISSGLFVMVTWGLSLWIAATFGHGLL